MGSFIVAASSSALAPYQLQVAATPTPQITTNPDNFSATAEHSEPQSPPSQQQQQMSPISMTSNAGDGCSTSSQTTPGGTTAVLTQDGQSIAIQGSTNVNPQLVPISQPTQPLYMSMQAAVQQPRIVSVRTPQGKIFRSKNSIHLLTFVLILFYYLGGIQHFIEYPTSQLLQAQQQLQPQFIQHNAPLVQVLRPPVAYSSASLIQQLQLQQQQQQVLAAQLQAQQLTPVQQPGNAILLQNATGQIVLAQSNPQAMRVVQVPYVPK